MSLNNGLKYIIDKNYDYFITFDADNQHKSSELENFINHIYTGVMRLLLVIDQKE